MKRLSLAVLAALLAAGVALAEPTPEPVNPVPTPVSWAEMDVSLLLPAGWQASFEGDDTSVLLARPAEGSAWFYAQISDRATEETQLPTADFEAAAERLQAYGFSRAEGVLLGDRALRFTGRDASGAVISAAVGRLPDHRTVTLIGSAPDFDPIANSLTPGADQAPLAFRQSVEWITALPAPAETPFDAGQTQITALAASDDRVAAVSPAGGVMLFDALGRSIGVFPFDEPAQPTGAAFRADGALLVADTVCRCIRVLGPNGGWSRLDDAFAANAPFALAARPGGGITVDRVDDTYQLRPITDPPSPAVPLSFNAAAAPQIAPYPGGVLIVEWLSSLIDGQVAAAVSRLPDGAQTPEFLTWLQLAPESVVGTAASADGGLILALSDGRILAALPDGTLTPLAQDLPPLAAAAASPDGDLFAATTDGRLMALSRSRQPDRVGADLLTADVPVLGRLSDGLPAQGWTFDGAAGDIITLSATDLQRRDTVDMGLRLLGPDGVEVAANDDQAGADLWGDFDAQIASVPLPADGRYTVIVERVQGAGGEYALILSPERRFALEDLAVTLEGDISDVAPVQRWRFSGQRGDIVTFTMTAQSGDLDPTLTLRLADGRRVAYNDDGPDPALGTNAQIFRVELPRDDEYVLEASRFDFNGAGQYELVVFKG